MLLNRQLWRGNQRDRIRRSRRCCRMFKRAQQYLMCRSGSRSELTGRTMDEWKMIATEMATVMATVMARLWSVFDHGTCHYVNARRRGCVGVRASTVEIYVVTLCSRPNSAKRGEGERAQLRDVCFGGRQETKSGSDVVVRKCTVSPRGRAVLLE